MAKVSFSAAKAEGSVDEQAAEKEATRLEGGATETKATETAAVAVVTPAPSDVGFLTNEDDVSIEDVIFPRLNIVQKVGGLSDNFRPGEIVLNQSLVLPQPVKLVVIGFRPTQFVEKSTDGSGLIVNSEEEVVREGGTIDYNEAEQTDKPLFQRMETALLLIEKAEELDDLAFPHVHEGRHYAVALWSMKGGAYTAGARTFKTEKKMGALRNGYRTGTWNLEAKLKSYRTGNSAYIPSLKLAARTDEKFQNWVTELLGF